MYIPVVLRNGQELTVEKDKFQYLLANNQILFFKRTKGWVVVGRDPLRGKLLPYSEGERRNLEAYSAKYWY